MLQRVTAEAHEHGHTVCAVAAFELAFHSFAHCSKRVLQQRGMGNRCRCNGTRRCVGSTPMLFLVRVLGTS